MEMPTAEAQLDGRILLNRLAEPVEIAQMACFVPKMGWLLRRRRIRSQWRRTRKLKQERFHAHEA
tara:strand:- start:2443 stop:2637 length:195 start_codon:yes stop_codon:yes gene_type:complete